MPRLVVVCGIAVLAIGCGATLRSGRPARGSDDPRLVIAEHTSDRCIHGTPGPDSPYREALPGPETDPDLLPFLARFTPDVRRTAVAAGLEPLLARLLRQHAADAGIQSEALIAMRQELAERIDTLETQLTAMEFETDCLRSLLYEVLGAYEEIETDRQLELTVWSLAVGAATGVAAALWDLANTHTTDPAWPDGPVALSVAGALATTGLGLALLVRQQRESVYVHEHNLLAPIVTGADPDLLYPTFVFRLLTLPTTDGSPTPRERLAEELEERLGDTVSDDQLAVAREILYGVGGTYDESLLALHQEDLQDLGATLDSFARDIDLLVHSVAIALEDEFDREIDRSLYPSSR